MDFLIDPNVAYLILVIGFIVGVLALFTPGTGFLEVGALLAIGFAGYAVYNLPINFWALILLVVGVVPFLIAVRKFKRWVLLLPAIASIVVGSIFLFRTATGAPAIDPILATVVSIIAVVMFYIITRKGLDALKMRPAQDLKILVGKVGEARTDIHYDGTIYVGGEEWSARSPKPIRKGKLARVTGREGLVLLVEPADEES
jgi:membrane-bound serine protease (ClpP class)